jgi:hypothetical protein
MKGQSGIAKKHKINNLNIPASDFVIASLIALTASQRFQRKIVVSDDDVKNY